MNATDRAARVESEIVAPLRRAGAELDELHRARLASAIEAALDRDAHTVHTEHAEKSGRGRRAWLWRAGIAASVALAAAIVVRATRAPHPPAGHVVSSESVVSAPAPKAPELLVPYQGPGDVPAALTPSTRLLALPGERARATIGTRVRLTLVGAGRVSVLPVARASEIELALESGRLLVDFDGHDGGTLRIRAAGAVTTVVGTLFAVEANGSGSRVAVARGHVRTRDAAGHVWQIAAGSSWSSADGRLTPIGGELAAALADHEASWTAGSTSMNARRPSARLEAERAAPAAPAAPPVDLEALYLRAEAAMRARAFADARAALETIATGDRGGQLGNAALLDLARLALTEGDHEAARRALERLPSPLDDGALAETAERLRSRVDAPARSSDRDGGEPAFKTPDRAR
jgi:ferric-dicitrate binding protein FerR (iron transport regulator)